MPIPNTIKLNFLDLKKLKGPETIHILKPKNINDVNQNYIILLGDNHSVPFQPETQGPDNMDKFLFKLNKLAKNIRIRRASVRSPTDFEYDFLYNVLLDLGRTNLQSTSLFVNCLPS